MPLATAISLRMSFADRDLFDRAAGAKGKTRSEFLLDAARAAATDALLDQRLFRLSPTEFKAFEKALAKAPRASDVAKSLRKRPAPWTA
jgi:uncharacterized protein (DUF1778 family)